MATFDVKAEFKVSGLAEVNAGFKTIGGNLKDVSKQFNAFSSAALKVGRNITIGLTAAAAAVASVSKSFADFEAQFTTVVTLLDESSFSTGSLEDGIADLEAGILALRAASGETFENLNQGLFDLVSAGVNAADAIRILGVATDLALVGATGTAIAVDGITTAMGAFGKAAGTAEQIADKFFVAQKFGKTTVEELANSLGLVAATAAASGVSFEELLAASAAATLSGIRTRAAFTGLRAALSNIQRPTAQAADEAERLGISFNASALQSKGLIGVLNDVTSASGFNQNSLIKLFSSTEALNVISAVTKNNFSDTNKILGELNKSSKSAAVFDDALARSKDTVAFSAGQLTGTFDSLRVEIGKALSPAIKELLELFTDLIGKIGPKLIKFFTEAGKRVADFLGGFTDVDIAVFVEELEQKFVSLIDTLKAVGSTLRDGFLLAVDLLRPIGIALEFIAQRLGIVDAKTIAAALAFLQFTGVLSLLKATGLLVKSLGVLFKNVFKVALIPLLKQFITLLGVGLVNAFGLVRIAAITTWAAVIGPIALLSLGFFGLGAAIVIFIAQLFGIKVTAIDVVKAIKNIPSEIIKVFTTLGSIIIGAVALVEIAIVETIKLIIDGWVFAFNFITDIIAQIILAGFELLAKLGDAISGAAQRFADFLADLGKALIDKFKEFIQAVADFGSQVLNGIKGIASDVLTFLSGGLSRFGDFVSAIIVQIKDAIFSLVTFIPRTIFQAFQGLVQRVGAIWDALVSRIKAAVNAIKRAVTFGLAGADSNQNSGATSPTQTFAGGGYVRGRGGTRADKIASWLSNKEYVMQAKAVKSFGVGFMDLINQGIMPAVAGFANGGFISDALNSLVTTRSSNTIRRLPVPETNNALTGTPFTIVMPNGRAIEAVTRGVSAVKELQQDIRKGNLLTSTDKPAWV